MRLPKAMAEQLRLKEGRAVDIEAKGDVLEVRATKWGGYRKFDRDELIDQIDPANVPESFDDAPVGTELL